MNRKGENMRRFWKEKSRQILAAVLTAVMLAGTWETYAGAAVLDDGYPEQEALQEESPEINADADGLDAETSGETLDNEGNEPESEFPGEIPAESLEDELETPPEGTEGTAGDPSESPSEEIPEEPSVSGENAQPEENGETPSDNNAEIIGQPELMAGALASARLDTSQYLMIYPAANKKYRWNTNGTGKNACVHLDENSGRDCTMDVKLEKSDGGVYYYSIKYSGSGYYIDSEKDDGKTGRVLHNGKKSRDQDNQLFRFVPVKDSKGNVKKNTYYILSKKGDNEKKELYIGLDKDQGIELKRKVATSSKPMEWVVENAAVDVPAGAEKLPENNTAPKTICMIYPKGYKRNVNVSSDSKKNGSALQLWLHGTSSKFNCEWDATYQAYRLGCMTISEDSLGTVWEVDGRRYEEGTAIHSWEKVGDSLSQLWRFVAQGDGVYRIQNAYTGKYAALKETKDADGVKLVISSTPMDWQVEVINVNSQNAEAVQWMSKLSDDVLLSDINIPGTHDTGTACTTAFGLNFSDSESVSVSKCQQLFVEEQFIAGVRALDLRIYEGDNNDNPDIVHGGQYAQCRKQDGSHLGLQDVLQKAKEFLAANPGETIIIKTGAQGTKGSVENVARALDHNIQSGRYPIYKPETASIPKLGEVRGKIVLMRAFSFGSYRPASKETYFGLDLNSGWGGDYDKIPGARQIYDSNGSRVWVQDAYTVNVTDKRSHVEKTIAQANGGEIPAGAYIWNFTSCTDPMVIIKGARDMASWFLSRDARAYRNGKKLGIVLMDYMDANMARAIYSNPPVEAVKFPTQVSMTYGQSLSQASASGGSAPGSFSFKNPETVPSKTGTYVFTMVYTPLDPDDLGMEQDVTVTVGKAAQRLKNSFASLKRKTGGKSVTAKISGANTKLTFTSSDPNTARVDKNGRIRFVSVGKAVITVRAAENENYLAASKQFTVTVIPKTTGIRNLASSGKGNILFKIKNASKAYTGYEVQYRVNKSKKVHTKKVKRGSLKKSHLNKFKSGDVIRLRVRAYQTVGKKTYYGRYGVYRTVKVK